MEYGEAISAAAEETAFELACKELALRPTDVRKVATEAVAKSYCVCVVDGEDAAEDGISGIHLDLIDRLEARLRAWLENERGQ